MPAIGLGAWLAKRRLKSPDKTALVYGEQAISYRQFADSADSLASLLTSWGVQPGDRVACLGDNTPTFLTVMFGALQIGAVFVPINVRLAPPEIEHVLRDSGASVLVYDERFQRALEVADVSIVRTVLPTGPGTDEEPGLLRLLSDANSGSPLSVNNEPDDPAVIMYTSGTTGRSKGAVLTHANLTWNALNCVVDFDIVSTDVALMISPLFHAAALGMGALPVILKGATLVLEPSFDAGRTLRLVESQQVTMISGVPTTFQLMADHEFWPATDLSTLKKITCGGSAVPTRVLEQFEARGLSFSQGYGLTETSPGATALSADMTKIKQGSVGVAHFFTQVRVVDSRGHCLAPGAVGEIEIQGPNVFLGYHNLVDATVASMSADGWFRSGDLGYVDSDGYLFIADRLKDLIISGGENIYPAEIENLLNDITGVTAAAVIGVPDDRWGEVPVAVLTLRPGTSIRSDDVLRQLQNRIARYKMPKRVIVIDEFPRTASGKIRKADLRVFVDGGSLS